MLHEQGEITQTVACNLLHEKDGIKQTMCLNALSFLGNFYHPYIQFNGKVFRASRCTLRESKTWLNQRSVQLVARIRRNYPDRSVQLVARKNGIKQTMCLKARSLLGRFYPFTKINGNIFRASRCTLRESKTWLNQRRVQHSARTRRN